jgi:uncharacterized lipoprotein YajG
MGTKQHASAVWALLCAVTVLAGCNTVSSVGYTPTGSVVAVASPEIASVAVTDQRKEAPNRLATIMGGFGNPLKTLDTPKPVKDEVADAFIQGLQARDMLASTAAPFRIFVALRKFDADMIIGRTARIDLTMQVADQSGRVVFRRDVADSVSDMKFLQTGVFASIDDLRVLAKTVLDRTVDKLLDDPSFRAAIGS